MDKKHPDYPLQGQKIKIHMWSRKFMSRSRTKGYNILMRGGIENPQDN